MKSDYIDSGLLLWIQSLHSRVRLWYYSMHIISMQDKNWSTTLINLRFPCLCMRVNVCARADYSNCNSHIVIDAYMTTTAQKERLNFDFSAMSIHCVTSFQVLRTPPPLSVRHCLRGACWLPLCLKPLMLFACWRRREKSKEKNSLEPVWTRNTWQNRGIKRKRKLNSTLNVNYCISVKQEVPDLQFTRGICSSSCSGSDCLIKTLMSSKSAIIQLH